MTTVLILLIASLILIGWTLRSTLHDDGRSTRRPPRSHFEDPTFLSPTRRL